MMHTPLSNLARRTHGMNDPSNATRGPASARRGVAMLLVLIALGVGIVLAGVALTSREPAARIGENASDDAAARWGAFAAAGYAEAVLQTSADCVDYAGDNSGALIRTFAINGGDATVTLTRLDGSAPQPGDRELLMTAVAQVNGISATVSKRVSLAEPVPMNVAADVRLNEFALFAGTSIRIRDGAVVAMSPAAAEAGTPVPVKIGSGFSSGSALVVDNAVLSNVAVYVDDNASAALDALLGDDKYCNGAHIPYRIPLVRDTSPPQVATLPILSATLAVINGAVNSLTLPGGNYLDLNVQGGATVTLGVPNQQTVYKFSNITLIGASKIRFQGDVIVQASGAMSLTGASGITPADANSSIAMYIGRNVTIDNAVIGLSTALAANPHRMITDVTSHPCPDTVFLSTLNTSSGGSASPTWQISQKSLVLASIHAPQSSLTIASNSALIGRATCGSFDLEGECGLYYDPRLDPRAGFTEFSGPLYLNGGALSQVASLFSTVSAAAGAQVFQDSLVSTLTTVWSSSPHPIVAVAAPLTGESGSDVVIDNAGNANARARGKARLAAEAGRAREFEH